MESVVLKRIVLSLRNTFEVVERGCPVKYSLSHNFAAGEEYCLKLEAYWRWLADWNDSGWQVGAAANDGWLTGTTVDK